MGQKKKCLFYMTTDQNNLDKMSHANEGESKFLKSNKSLSQLIDLRY